MFYPVKDLIEDCPVGHSNFQCDNFITKKSGGHTLWGQYKQALREFSTRYDTFVGYIFEFKENQLRLDKSKEKLKLMEEKLEKMSGSEATLYKYDVELHRNKIIKREYYFNDSKQILEKAQREMFRFYAQACILKEKLEQAHGSLTQDIKEVLEEDYWTNSIYELAAMHYMNGETDVNKIILESVNKTANFNHWPTSLQKKVISQINNKDVIMKKMLDKPVEFFTNKEIDDKVNAININKFVIESIGNDKLLVN